MREQINLEYFYGIEAEQFAFYRIPKLLIKDITTESVVAAENYLKPMA